jgi:hypothetical protein
MSEVFKCFLHAYQNQDERTCQKQPSSEQEKSSIEDHISSCAVEAPQVVFSLTL